MTQPSDDNPYASPCAETFDAPPEQLPDDSPGLWRQGEMLVMHREARWPARCVITNELATQVVSWVVGLYPTMTAVNLSISAVYLARWRWATFFCVGTMLLFLEEAIRWKWSGTSSLTGDLGAWLLLGVGVVFSAAYYLGYLCPLDLHHSGTHYVWLRGVHPDYLAHLPKWPYEPK